MVLIDRTSNLEKIRSSYRHLFIAAVMHVFELTGLGRLFVPSNEGDWGELKLAVDDEVLSR